MMGIYCFTNIINGKKYIGQSSQLEERKKQHIRHYKNNYSYDYNKKLYKAFREFGLENFKYEILYEKDFITREELNKLEIFYINKFNSYKNGYNMNLGGNFTSSDKSLTEENILQIYEDLKDNTLTFLQIAKKYGVCDSLISQINDGKIWNRFNNIEYPIRKNTHIKNIGGNNPNAVLNDEKVLELRKKYVKQSLTYISDKNPEISFSTLKKAVYGNSFKHLPIYKKREKKWYLNGTCIDYPRLEE